MKKRIAALLILSMLISGHAGLIVNVNASELEAGAVIAADNGLTVLDEETDVTIPEGTGSWIDIQDGMAQPKVSYSEISEDYTNTGSDILRFAVYVETDYDTDKDGARDLVQAVVQVPRAAALQEYDAPTIFEASPYFAGTDGSTGLKINEEGGMIPMSASADEVGTWTEDELYVKYEGDDNKRPYKEADKLTSLMLAEKDNDPRFSTSNWYYRYEDVPYNADYYLSSLNNHDYFLIRGFAVVESAGLGTNGSDGLETCGSIAEVSAFKNVVEWINHKEGRHAFADREGTIPIEADWSNGKVAMRGCSYNGTMAYEVAATGVEGLETIVPEDGIASWYEYTNTQGVTHYSDNKYTTILAAGNSSRFFGRDPMQTQNPEKWEALRQLSSKLFGYFDNAQKLLEGKYGKYWEDREYSQTDSIKASALILNGLNDYNVTTKQADLMRQAFEKNGTDVRMILHQGGHETLETIMIDGMFYEEMLNKWYCHYLLDVNNGMPDDLPGVYVQSNVDGSFIQYDKWYGDKELSCDFVNEDEITLLYPPVDTTSAEDATPLKPGNPSAGNDIMMSGENPYYTIDDYIESLGVYPDTLTEDDNQTYWESLAKRVPEELTIQGKTTLKVRAKVPKLPDAGKRMVLGAFLYDISDVSFPAYKTNPKNSDCVDRYTYIENGFYRGEGLDNYNIDLFEQTDVNKKLITKGMVNLGCPGAGYEPYTAVDGAVTKDCFYDYTIHMLPTVYTIKPGHYLWIYLIPGMDGINSDVDVVLDKHAGFISIPVSEIPEGFDENNDFSEECTKDPYGKKITEKVSGTNVAVKLVDGDANLATLSSNIWIKDLAEEYIYMGTPVIPDVKVYDGTDLLVLNKDYTISCTGNNMPSDVSGRDANLTITFIDEYANTSDINETFKIGRTILSDNSAESFVIADDITAAYTGKDLKPVPDLIYNDDSGRKINKKGLKFSYLKDGDYEPTDSISEAGEYTVIIEPANEKSYFTGMMTSYLTVIESNRHLLKDARVTFTKRTYDYAGEEITPDEGTYSLKIKLDKSGYTPLIENTDYIISNVEKNLDPGKAEVTFTAVEGNDKGLVGSVKGTFTIKKGRDFKLLSANDIDYESYVNYSKSGAVPSWIDVYDKGRLLVEGQDYTVSCKDNKKLTSGDGSNKAQLVIKGKGKYKGSVTRDFYIVKANIAKFNVSVKDKVIPAKLSGKYKGYENPDITVTDAKGKKLKKDTDYKITSYESISGNEASYEIDDTKAGLIRVTINGIGNYFGKASADYMYYDKKNDLSKTTQWKEIGPKEYNGKEVELTAEDLKELLASGTKSKPGTYLVEGDDFTVESYSKSKTGTVSVVLRGRGIYGGKKIIKFELKRRGAKSFLGILK